MRTFVCIVFYCVCLQINVVLPPSFLMLGLLFVAAVQDVRELVREEGGR